MILAIRLRQQEVKKGKSQVAPFDFNPNWSMSVCNAGIFVGEGKLALQACCV